MLTKWDLPPRPDGISDKNWEWAIKLFCDVKKLAETNLDLALFFLRKANSMLSIEKELDNIVKVPLSEEAYLRSERLSIQLEDWRGRTYEQHCQWRIPEMKDRLNRKYPQNVLPSKIDIKQAA